ncbi:hypothetical protein C8R43DRAFT_1233084 [Mycena crocata]|nr:hypothetical protein C8R43DRAFT_1233084 [Mycena crocata]
MSANFLNHLFGQMIWIEHRDIDGGPIALLYNNIAAWYNTFVTAADVTANIMGDASLM